MILVDILHQKFPIMVTLATQYTLHDLQATEDEAIKWCVKKFGRPSYVNVEYTPGGDPIVRYTRPNAFWVQCGDAFLFWKDTDAVLEFKLKFG